MELTIRALELVTALMSLASVAVETPHSGARGKKEAEAELLALRS